MDLLKFVEALTPAEKTKIRLLIDKQNEKIGNKLLSSLMQDKTISVRLYAAIRLVVEGGDLMLKEVKPEHFYKIRNVGKKTWKEFEDIRGW